MSTPTPQTPSFAPWPSAGLQVRLGHGAGALALLAMLAACEPEKKPEPEPEALDEGNNSEPRQPARNVTGGLPSSGSVPHPVDEEHDGGVLLDGGLPRDASTEVDPDAALGCRAPDEPGCATCCSEDALSGGGCIISSGQGWYNSQAFEPGGCPVDCAPCARCSRRDEEQLRGLAERPDCGECVGTPVADPCFAPASCSCYCSTRAELVARCGELAP